MWKLLQDKLCKRYVHYVIFHATIEQKCTVFRKTVMVIMKELDLRAEEV